MSFLCKKAITLNGVVYNPGDSIPDDAILGTRVRSLKTSGCIVEPGSIAESQKSVPEKPGAFYTQEELEEKVAEAVQEAIGNIKESGTEILESVPGAFEGTVIIPIKIEGESGKNAEYMALPMKSEDIAQAISIMQMNVEEGSKAISEITEENVLIALHAADSRTTIKNAAKKQVDTLTSIDAKNNEAVNGKSTTDATTDGDTPNTEGGDA